MGKINKFNYYPYQDLSLTRPVILKMLSKKRKLKTIFKFLRGEARWDAIGDYPIISFTCKVAKQNGNKTKSKDVRDMFRETEEFKRIQQNSDFISQVCA